MSGCECGGVCGLGVSVSRAVGGCLQGGIGVSGGGMDYLQRCGGVWGWVWGCLGVGVSGGQSGLCQLNSCDMAFLICMFCFCF